MSLAAGAVLTGAVQGGSATNTLQLGTGAAPGTLSGFATQFSDFGTIQVDGGANWQLGGTGETIGASIALTGTLTDTETGAVTLSGPVSGMGTLAVAAGVRLSLAASGAVAAGLRLTNAGTFTKAGLIATTVTLATGAVLGNSGTIATTTNGAVATVPARVSRGRRVQVG